MPSHNVSPEKAALDRILAELGPLPVGVAVFRGQGKANRVDGPGWDLSVILRFQFGDLRLESDRCRVVVECESAGGVSNLAKYWPLLRGGLDSKKFLLLHLFFVSSQGDYIAHRKLWQFVVNEMHKDRSLTVDWADGRLLPDGRRWCRGLIRSGIGPGRARYSGAPSRPLGARSALDSSTLPPAYVGTYHPSVVIFTQSQEVKTRRLPI
jgi:hypothetical protein